jgi:hypothetical protein
MSPPVGAGGDAGSQAGDAERGELPGKACSGQVRGIKVRLVTASFLCRKPPATAWQRR